jgi:hypothetical protein
LDPDLGPATVVLIAMHSNPARRPRRVGIVAAVIFALVAAALYLALTARPSVMTVKLPDPNGYDDFVKASGSIVQWTGDLAAVPSPARLTTLQLNSNALALVRRGLVHEYAVPLTNGGDWSQQLSNLAAFKGLAQLLKAEGAIAEADGRTNDAVRSYADIVEFGDRLARGGLRIDDLVGIAVKALGREPLDRLAPDIAGASRIELLKRLAAIEARSENAGAVLDREHMWSRREFGLLQRMWHRLVSFNALRQSEEKHRKKHERSIVELRLLEANLAVLAFYAEHHALPAKLSDLVPGKLHAAPFDPFSGKPIRYVTRTNSFLLYSVGPDGIDDRGKPLTRSSMDKGDLISVGAVPTSTE